MPSPASVLSVETPESVAFAYELAGLGSRGIAFALDSLVLARHHPRRGASSSAPPRCSSSTSRDANLLMLLGPWVLAVLLVLVFVTYWGYFVFGEIARGGRTPGKRALGIRVVRDDGSRVGLVDSLIRNFLRLVDALPGSYAVGIVSVLVSRKNKRLGDIAGGDGRRARRRRADAALRRRRVGRARRARARVPRRGARS